MTGVPGRRADLATATVVSPSPRQTTLRLVLSTLAGVGGGLAVGAPLGRWATVAGRGPGFLSGLCELVLAVVVSVLVGVAVAVLTLRAASRTDPARRRLVLAYGLSFLGLLLSVAVAAAPFFLPLLVVVPLVVVRRLRARWLVVTLGLIGTGVGVLAVGFHLDQQRQDARALEAYFGPLLTFTPPAPFVLDDLTPPSVSYRV
ncbi:hypothetical protein WDZ17_14790 [Pseudokineococcus basanitobsidens]|uniref:Uncharacterized protein n=1 Tax=Pseudokineococcus basanitobsidens TaxID=1926649 RepID=A0ABU8RNC2_9ACTN